MNKEWVLTSNFELGKLLKKRRKELKMTQIELANYSKLSHTGIGRIESAENDVQFKTLLKISKFLGFKIKIEFED